MATVTLVVIRRTGGSAFSIKIDPTDKVAELKDRIKSECSNALAAVDANSLLLARVWTQDHAGVRSTVFNKKEPTLLASISSQILSHDQPEDIEYESADDDHASYPGLFLTLPSAAAGNIFVKVMNSAFSLKKYFESVDFDEDGIIQVFAFANKLQSNQGPEKTEYSADSKVTRLVFLQSLRQAGIRVSSPDVQKIIDIIAARYSNRMITAAGSPDACYDLYTFVKDLPATFTRGVIQDKLNININDPLAGQTSILTAVDKSSGERLIIKLLTNPHLLVSAPSSKMAISIEYEVKNCETISKAKIPGLVHAEIVTVTVERSDGLSVSGGDWTALKMPHYLSSLAQSPQLSEKVLYREFQRLLTALNSLHNLNLVHMDIKSDNVFVDRNSVCHLGDFGSCRSTDSLVWTFTEVYTPFPLKLDESTVIPAMDIVMLCVMFSVEIDKEHWKDRLRGKTQRVQHALIMESLSSIHDSSFRQTIIPLYESHYAKVLEHLAKQSI